MDDPRGSNVVIGGGQSGLAAGYHLCRRGVPGAAAQGGTLYAISAAHSTLLVIALESEALTAAFAVPGMDWPVGLVAGRGRRNSM